MEVNVRPVEKEASHIIENLMQLYLHDFSSFLPSVVPDAEGVFHYPYLPHYWRDPRRYPFFILANHQIAGFALLQLESDPANHLEQMDMTEFFVLRSYRRQQIATRAVRQLWDRFPGRWQIRVMKNNVDAYPFWKKVISAYTSGDFQEAIGSGAMLDALVFHFESDPAG